MYPTVYKPRKWMPTRKTARKVIFWQMVCLSLVMNLWFARQFYVVKCSAGGYLMSKQQCGEIAQSKEDSQFYASEYARLEGQIEELKTAQLNQ